MASFNPTYARVENEECDLYYWYQGTGPLITFIPGGNGHGRQYNGLIAALSHKYTCATFDRRQMSNSQVKVNKPFSFEQQARDVVAVIKAVGFSKSILFGSSMGGAIAFQVAIDFPDIVDHLISHEGVSLQLLPDKERNEVKDRIKGYLEIYRTEGLEATSKAWSVEFIGFDEGTPAPLHPEESNAVNQFEWEFPYAIDYEQDLNRLVENGTRVGVMAGARSRDAFYAKGTIYQQEVLKCTRMVVPGHHEGFQCEMEEFLPFFHEMLDILENKRAERTGKTGSIVEVI